MTQEKEVRRTYILLWLDVDTGVNADGGQWTVESATEWGFTLAYCHDKHPIIFE